MAIYPPSTFHGWLEVLTNSMSGGGLIYNYFVFLTVNEMRHKFMSDNTHQGVGRAFHRDHVYEDVINRLYAEL